MADIENAISELHQEIIIPRANQILRKVKPWTDDINLRKRDWHAFHYICERGQCERWELYYTMAEMPQYKANMVKRIGVTVQNLTWVGVIETIEPTGGYETIYIKPPEKWHKRPTQIYLFDITRV